MYARVASNQITANLNAALAPRLVDARQTTSWASGSTTAPKISTLMASAFNIGAIAFGNCRNVAGESITLSHGATLGAATTAVATFTAPDDEDFLVEFTPVGTNPGWVVQFNSTVSVSTSIGTLSVLDSDEMIEFDTGESPDFPIGIDI